MAGKLIGCVIAYNEEELLPVCLASVGEKVDRLVVVDGRIATFPGEGAASTDWTLEIAHSFGAEVIEAEAPWADEAAKRSAYLVGDEGDWYFMLDADERLMTPLPRPDELPGTAYQIRVIAPSPLVVGWRLRLFKHVGCMEYRHTHYALFSDGRLLIGDPKTPKLHSVWLLHREAQRNKERRAQKAIYYQVGYAHEPEWRKKLGI